MNLFWTAIFYHSKVQSRPVALICVNYHVLGNINAISAANLEAELENFLEASAIIFFRSRFCETKLAEDVDGSHGVRA